MFTSLFFDLLSLLGTLVVCILIAIVGIIFCLLVGSIITGIVKAFKKINSEGNGDGSNT